MSDTTTAHPTEHFVCLPCLRYQRQDDICADCGAVMVHGTLCRCGEHLAADGANECVECLADEVRLDPSALEGMYGRLRDEVLAHLRKGAKASYSEGFMVRRQVGER